VQTKFAGECGHLEDAEKFVEKISGEKRSDFAGVIGRRDFDEVATDDVEAAQGANEFEDLDASETADLRRARAGSVGGIRDVDIESDVDGFVTESAHMTLNRWQTFFVKFFGGDHLYFVGAGEIKIVFAVDLAAKAYLQNASIE